MDLSPAQLAFLEHEMRTLMTNEDRDYEDRKAASTIAGQAEGELGFEADTHEWVEAEKIPHTTESLVE